MNEIQYRPGNTNYVADELFRNPPDPLTDKSLRTTVKTTQEMKTLMVNRIRDGPPIEEVIADYQLLKLYEDAPKELLATVRPRSTPTPRKGKKRKAADEKESTSQDDGLRGMIQLVIDQQQQILKNQETMIKLYQECLNRLGVVETRVHGLQEVRKSVALQSPSTDPPAAHIPTPHAEKPSPGGGFGFLKKKKKVRNR